MVKALPCNQQVVFSSVGITGVAKLPIRMWSSRLVASLLSCLLVRKIEFPQELNPDLSEC